MRYEQQNLKVSGEITLVIVESRRVMIQTMMSYQTSILSQI